MTAATPPPTPALRGWAAAGVLLGVGWLVVGAAIGFVVGFGVPSPAELLIDVHDARALWVAAMGLQTGQQLLLVPFGLALVVRLAPIDGLQIGAVGALALSAVFFGVSGIVHGVFGVHQAVDTSEIDALTASQIDLATVTHAIADTSYFAGIIATAIATWLLCRRMAMDGAETRHLVGLGHAAVVCHALQFGWFFVPAMGGFGAAGGLLQGLWFIVVARWVGRTAPGIRGTVVSGL